MSSTSPTQAHDGHAVVHQSKEQLVRIGREVREDLATPGALGAITGAAILGAALLIGLPETIVGAATGLVVYRILSGAREARRP
jgi:hypothetical protein